MPNYKTELQKLYHNLNVLLKLEAQHGGQDLRNQIEDHLTAITLTEQAIRGQITTTRWQTELEPLLGSLERTQPVAQNAYRQVIPTAVDPATLTAAEARLAQMPQAEFAAASTCPPPAAGSRLVFTPNPLFVGREAELLALAQLLAQQTTTIICPAESTPEAGGIGKSQLANAFVYRYGQYFAGGVFWLNFAQPALIRSEIAACGGPAALNLHPTFNRLPMRRQIQLVLAAWQSPLPRLLVFDNCADEALLARWQPHTGGCRVLVTSRRRQWQPGLKVTTLPLEALPRPQSISLLRQFNPELTAAAPTLSPLAAELGDQPLALRLASNMLKIHAESGPVAILAKLQTDLAANRRQYAGRAFAINYSQLKPKNEIDKQARAVLARCAILAANAPIPPDLLLLSIKTATATESEAQRILNQALSRLVRLGLLNREQNGAITMPQLVAELARQKIDQYAQQAARASLEHAILVAIDHRKNPRGNYGPETAELMPHLQVLAGAALLREDEQAARLTNRFGAYLYQTADLAGAHNYLRHTLTIREKISGPQHPTTATSFNNLGILLENMGQSTAARVYYQHALAIRETVFGPYHINTQRTRQKLAALNRASRRHSMDII